MLKGLIFFFFFFTEFLLFGTFTIYTVANKATQNRAQARSKETSKKLQNKPTKG